MASAVLDSSVLLAHIGGEKGSEAVPELASGALLSTVNLAEVFAKLLERNFTAIERTVRIPSPAEATRLACSARR